MSPYIILHIFLAFSYCSFFWKLKGEFLLRDFRSHNLGFLTEKYLSYNTRALSSDEILGIKSTCKVGQSREVLIERGRRISDPFPPLTLNGFHWTWKDCLMAKIVFKNQRNKQTNKSPHKYFIKYLLALNNKDNRKSKNMKGIYTTWMGYNGHYNINFHLHSLAQWRLFIISSA